MNTKAGFAEIDITPPVGTHKIGWIIDIVSEQVLDPLYARVAVFDDGRDRAGFVQIDTLSVRWSQANEIRRRIEAKHGFPGANIMVSATHNHAGPAVAGMCRTARDEAYVETMVARCVEAFGRALASMRDAELGFNLVFEHEVGHNRRVMMRDGTVRTHGKFTAEPCALCLEGPIDPEFAVLAARAPGGALLGCIVNHACHPTHHGPDKTISAGFPGLVCASLKSRGCPVTVYLNGACGNISATDQCAGRQMSMEDAGARLTADAVHALEGMKFGQDWPVGAAATTVQLPYRRITPDEIAGTARGAQRFVDPKAYDEAMPELVRRIETRKRQPAEVQAVFIGNLAFVGIPAEYFVEHGLRIKLESYPAHALVVGEANGMVGYVPTKQAFERGGYETTFGPGSHLAPEAGDLLADAAIRLVQQRRNA